MVQVKEFSVYLFSNLLFILGIQGLQDFALVNLPHRIHTCSSVAWSSVPDLGVKISLLLQLLLLCRLSAPSFSGTRREILPWIHVLGTCEGSAPSSEMFLGLVPPRLRPQWLDTTWAGESRWNSGAGVHTGPRARTCVHVNSAPQPRNGCGFPLIHILKQLFSTVGLTPVTLTHANAHANAHPRRHGTWSCL